MINVHPNIIDFAVANAFGVRITDIYNQSQKRSRTDMRKIAYMYMHDLAGLSYPEIQRRFRRKSHTGILQMKQSAINLMQTSKDFREKCTRVQQIINDAMINKEHHHRKRKKLYNIHYSLRQRGVKLSCYKRCIFMPLSKSDEIIQKHHKQIMFLQNQGYSVQLEIDN